ncbi:MAG: hypothetical protein UT90_C0002G0042 [Parcubacteria group bacterium GW2011_GWA1_40_21]|nr:MAG: hypothetical protein UT80_C0030G0009 [Parcubacteria group bacterium GW2011_GWC1_40_13]KKR54085.1 MAG: hypothetical protein UT90_C0002G0042 [Parcubacteria group bacterium GW2011_GWA1_40_21]
MRKRKNNNSTIKDIVTYCPQCDDVPEVNGDSIAVAEECLKHKLKFKKSDNGVMVSGVPVEMFNEMMKPVSLSSQEI